MGRGSLQAAITNAALEAAAAGRIRKKYLHRYDNNGNIEFSQPKFEQEISCFPIRELYRVIAYIPEHISS